MLINLLLAEQKRELRAARLNVVLLRYTFLAAAAILFMLVILGVGFVITMYTQNAARAELDEYQQVARQYADVKKQAEAFEADLATAEKILSSEIVFSNFMVDLARFLPPGNVLSSLAVTTESFGQNVTISARTQTYDGPLDLKKYLEDSSLFEDVRLIDISRTATTDDDLEGIAREYPYTSTLSATLSKPSTGERQ